MFKAIGNLLGVGAGDIFGGVTGGLGAWWKNEEAKKAAERQMNFQRYMSGTAYGRAMRDMQSAGLNPMLAYSQGGASTPGGAMYQPGDIGAGITQGVGAVASANQANEQAAKLEEETDKVIQDTKIQKVIHDERWPRLFSSMSKENVVASLVAAYYQVPMESILKGFPKGMSPRTKKALVDMFDELQAAGSFFQKETAGALSVSRAVSKVLEKALDEVSTRTMEGARRVRDAAKDIWQ